MRFAQIDSAGHELFVVILAKANHSVPLFELAHVDIVGALRPFGRAVKVDDPLDVLLADGRRGRVLVESHNDATPSGLGSRTRFLLLFLVLLDRRSWYGRAEHSKLDEQRGEASFLHRILPSITRRCARDNFPFAPRASRLQAAHYKPTPTRSKA